MLEFNEIIGKTFNFYGVVDDSFKLDEIVWVAIEDDDGYHSGLETIMPTTFIDDRFSKEILARVQVTDQSGDTEQRYSLIDDSGWDWLSVGTADTDDYYPSYFFMYYPKK